MPDDFETLVAKTRIEPNNAQRTSLRNVVKKIIKDTETLTTMMNQSFGEFDAAKGMLSNLRDIKSYQDGFNGGDGWYWHPETWKLANDKLIDCKTKLENIREEQHDADRNEKQVLTLTILITHCDTCLVHMQTYKEFFEKIPLEANLSILERTMRRGGLKSQLEVLKVSHDM